MTILRETITVARPAGECYRYVADFSTIEQWDPGVYRATKTTDGAPKVGSEFDLLLNSGGRRIPMTYRLEEMVADKRLVLSGTSDKVRARDVISFRALGSQKTEIEYCADLEFSGVLGAGEGMLAPWLKRIGTRAARGLQRALAPPSATPGVTVVDKLKQWTVLPAAWEFTERGYLNMEQKGLSEFIDHKIAVITGPTGGLGLAASCELARLGAHLVVVGRSPEKLEKAVDEIRAFSGCSADDIDVVEADLSLLKQVRRAATEIRAITDRVDILIHNAGALFAERQQTEEGHEKTLAVNLLCPFVLTEALLEPLQESGGRVITVASGGIYTQALHLDDMEFENESFDGAKAYARTKRGLVAMTDHWAHAFADDDLTFNSMHPGWADTPGVARSLPRFYNILEGRLRDSRMGADTIVWLASSSAVDGVSGQFFFDRKPRPKSVFPGTDVSDVEREQLMQWLQRHQ